MVAFRKTTPLSVLLLVLACGGSSTPAEVVKTNLGASGPTLNITNPEAGAVVEGNVVELNLEADGIRILAASDDPGGGRTGHYHIFIDKDPAEPGAAIPTGDPDVLHTAADLIQLTGLEVGQRRVAVVLGDLKHMRVGDAEAEISFMVEGPSVIVGGPATARAGAVIQVEATVEGVQLVDPADDESNRDGSSGHLHVFVNRNPTPIGEVIPVDDPAILHTTSQSVAFPADLFEVGTNVIWVMLGYADHTPFDPLVLDMVVVEVS